MKYSTKTQTKVLKTLISLADDTTKSRIEDFQNYIDKFNMNKNELEMYLRALEHEHIIDYDRLGFDDKITLITLFPAAYSYIPKQTGKKVYNMAVIIIAALTLITTVVGVILQFVLSATPHC